MWGSEKNMAKFYLFGNTTHCQMFGCVIETKNKTIVIDGGTVKDSNQLVDFLKHNSNSHVDAWFFTHPHHDHIGCFVDIGKNEPSVTVDMIYYHFPDLTDSVYASLSRSDFEAALWQDVNEWGIRYRTYNLLEGDCFEFDDVKIRVLRVFNPDIKNNCINNSSTVYRIDGNQGSILILGDLGIEGGTELMHKYSFDMLNTDYTQMAHHGQNGVNKDFYEYIKPKRCIWAAPEWLWNNNRGNGFDTDIFQTVRTREWVEELGVVEHLVEKDGIQSFEF